MTIIYTTLNKIRACSPCGVKRDETSGFNQLLKFLGKTTSDDEQLKFSTILESNGIDDALWCLRSICPEYEKLVRLFAADCSERALHFFEEKFPEDKRPRQAIAAARKFANGEISQKELAAAWDAAGDAARGAARAAAGAAAGDAAWAAAWDAAWDAERKAQSAILIEYFG